MDNFDQQLYFMRRQDEEKEAQKIAEGLKLSYINLLNYPVAPDVLALIPESEAVKNGVIAYLRAGDKVRVAANNIDNPELRPYLQKLSQEKKLEFEISYCSKTSILYGVGLYKTLLPEVNQSGKVNVSEEEETSFEKSIQTFKDLKENISKVSTTELLDVIFAGAVKNDATDIHIEPQETYFRIRYRIDGILQDVAKLPLQTYKQVVSRIKFMSKLKYDVTRPQDGRFEVKVMDGSIDIRVSTLPTGYGEAIVMRLLPKDKKFSSIENLGFNEKALAMIKEAMSKPQGIILVTGPTGSGKTTTLYAILQKLNQEEKKIITFENPVEYRIEGIEQIQIDQENKTTFFDALRGALRQDPDIMMIGEIRDKETADIALQAAITGHLVLSTVHTNNAPATLARLAEMGVEPYLLAGSINLIVAQRLVRLTHKECQGKGCDNCNGTGYKGRMAIIEVLEPGPEIEKLILEKSPLRTFEEIAHTLGMQTMYEDGMDKVTQGLTTKEEVERVTKE